MESNKLKPSEYLSACAMEPHYSRSESISQNNTDDTIGERYLADTRKQQGERDGTHYKNKDDHLTLKIDAVPKLPFSQLPNLPGFSKFSSCKVRPEKVSNYYSNE